MSALPQYKDDDHLKERSPLLADPAELLALRDAREEQDAETLHASLMAQGQEMARLETSRVVSQMLQESPHSLRGIEERYGFAPAQLSRWSRGKLKGGAELSSLKALGEALGYTVRIVLETKT
ncbi:MAG: hypothetical protein AAGI10_12930 [Pseudomonadota bacterium]